MEEQCKKTLDKALEIYNKEMNAIVGNVEIKNATELKNKQKHHGARCDLITRMSWGQP